MTSDQDGDSQPQPYLNDPEDRQTPGEADEHIQTLDALVDVAGEITDALADAGQEAGEDGKAYSAEESVIQQTSADEPGGGIHPSPRPRPPITSVRAGKHDSPPPDIERDTDLVESSGEISDVVQDARQEPGADNAALHAEDRAPDG